MHLKADIEGMVEVTNTKTGKKEFLFLKNGKWVSENQYNKNLEGKKNDNI